MKTKILTSLFVLCAACSSASPEPTASQAAPYMTPTFYTRTDTARTGAAPQAGPVVCVPETYVSHWNPGDGMVMTVVPFTLLGSVVYFYNFTVTGNDQQTFVTACVPATNFKGAAGAKTTIWNTHQVGPGTRTDALASLPWWWVPSALGVNSGFGAELNVGWAGLSSIMQVALSCPATGCDVTSTVQGIELIDAQQNPLIIHQYDFTSYSVEFPSVSTHDMGPASSKLCWASAVSSAGTPVALTGPMIDIENGDWVLKTSAVGTVPQKASATCITYALL